MSKDMPFSEIMKEIAEGNCRRGFVRCWHHFRYNKPAFQNAEAQALNRNPDYLAERARLLDVLWCGEKLRIRNFKSDYPLVLLDGLDEFLACRWAGVTPFAGELVRMEGEEYWIHLRKLSSGPRSFYANQTGHIQRWLRYHWVIPSEIDQVEIHFRRARISRVTVERCIEAEALRIFVCGFPDGVVPDWQCVGGDGYLASGLSDHDVRRRSVLEALRQAVKAEADIVVLPELTVPPELRREISEWLEREHHPFILVLPGSFHELIEGRNFNASELLSGTGRPVLSHRKLTASVLDGQREAIDSGHRIEVLDTAIGLIGIPICLDFCEEGPPFAQLWADLGGEWLLVPAFGPESSVRAHRRRARQLLRAHGGITALANQNPSAEAGNHGFVCHTGAHPASRGIDSFPCGITVVKLAVRT